MKMAQAFPFRFLLGISWCWLLLLSLGGTAIAQKSALGSTDEDADGGRVYAMTNDAAGNTIVVFHRDAQGNLAHIQDVSTGGLGSGPGPLPVQFGGPGPGPLPLDSQDSLVITENKRFLLAVNAGSNEVSVLAVTREGLQLVDKVSSGGIFPISIAHHDNLIYVLNLGAPKSFNPSPSSPSPNVTGFFLDFAGRLHMIPNSTRITGGPLSVPDDTVLSPDGRLLLVSELMTNSIGVYPLDSDGRTKERTTVPSHKPNPFGLAFGRHQTLAVVEANEIGDGIGVPNGSTISSYKVNDDGNLESLSVAVVSNQTAMCWVRFTPDGRLAYTVNAGSGTVSSFRVSSDGQLSLLAGVAADTGGPATVPIDFDITRDGKFLYLEASFIGAIQGYRIEEDGSLTRIATVSGFPITVEGLVAQ